MNQENSTRPLALVTGGASGIGKAVVQRLLRDQFRVIAMDRSEPNLTLLRERLADQGLICALTDLSEWKLLRKTCESLMEQHGPVKVLVNNAGVWPGGSIVDMSDQTWQSNLDV